MGICHYFLHLTEEIIILLITKKKISIISLALIWGPTSPDLKETVSRARIGAAVSLQHSHYPRIVVHGESAREKRAEEIWKTFLRAIRESGGEERGFSGEVTWGYSWKEVSSPQQKLGSYTVRMSFHHWGGRRETLKTLIKMLACISTLEKVCLCCQRNRSYTREERWLEDMHCIAECVRES